MIDPEFGRLETALRRAGHALDYPPTPALASHVREQIERERVKPASWNFSLRPALTIAFALFVALALLLAFPDTRNAIGQILSLRTIRIFQATPTSTPKFETPQSLRVPVTATPITLNPLVTYAPTRIPENKTQCCATTLSDARARAHFIIILPPNETPAQVFFQELPALGLGAQQIILIFGDSQSPRAVLYQATRLLYGKLISGGTQISETRVADSRALWLTGEPHVLVTLDASGQPRFETERSVYANTLVWETNELTFRFETNAPLADAVKFAESLK